jgi:exopolyphosphatase/guanosine-5'-triphosphate,3'-diphosphate pyrophosphatase
LPADADPDNGAEVRIAVLDVGSSTVRLLVAERRDGRIAPVRQARSLLLLGREVERQGALSARKLTETGRCARRFAALAREVGATRLEVVVTAPGRQSGNADELVRVLGEATAASVRVLSADEEGRLAWDGAVAAVTGPAPTLAVCDVGGGSTELLVGTPEAGPAWARSLDIGSVRLTERLLERDPPGKESVRVARAEVESAFDGLVVPLAHAALATGGTARALRKLVGERLGGAELARAMRRLTKGSAREIATSSGVDPERALTLPAGALILAEVQRRLRTPLIVSTAGLREGVALTLLREAAAA